MFFNWLKVIVFPRSVFWVSGLCLILLVGCGSEQDSRIPDRNSVTGSVSLDGEPLQEGSISFFSESDSANGIRAATNVVDGRYKLLVTSGKKKVMINQMVDVSELKTVEKIPAEYNSKTTLEANVTDGNRTFDFELKTK